MNKHKYCYHDFKNISRVFTDTIVNMWSIDYKNSDLAPDYVNFGDMPKVAQEFVKYCTNPKNKDGIIEVNGVTTSYRLAYKVNSMKEGK